MPNLVHCLVYRKLRRMENSWDALAGQLQTSLCCPSTSVCLPTICWGLMLIMRWDCVTVCDGCHTVVWGTCWDDYDSAARDAYFARNGWRNYCVPGDTEILELCPACAVRALRRGETRGLADTWLRPTHAYTHAFREVDAQLSARERVVANLLLTEGRTA